jgi:hypothetical protein
MAGQPSGRCHCGRSRQASPRMLSADTVLTADPAQRGGRDSLPGALSQVQPTAA